MGRHNRGSDNRGLCRQRARQRQNLAAAYQGHRAHRGRIFFRRHRPDRAGLADPGHARDQIRDRTGGRLRSAAPPCSACSSAPPARASSATAGAARPSTSSTCCCSASSRSSARSRRRVMVAGRRRASSPASASAPSSRSPSPTPANIRPRRSAAASWRSCISSAAPASGRSRSLFTLFFRDSIGWRGVWIVIGIGALIVWLFRFTLPESPRYLATHGKGKEALDVLGRLGIAGPTRAAHHERRERHQERSVRRRVQDVSEACDRRHDLLLGVLRRRDRTGHLAAEHHDREGLHHHQVAAPTRSA